MELYKNSVWKEVVLNNEQKNIPSDLIKKKIKDSVLINRENIKKSVEYINYVDIASVNDNKISQSHYLIDNFPSRAKRVIKYQDTIVSSVRPNLKCFSYVDTEFNNFVCSTGFFTLTPKEINDKFLYFLFKLDDTTNYLIKHSNGGTYPTFNSSVIENLEYINFSLKEQNNIANLLSSQEKVIEKTKELIKNIDKRNQFMIDELLSGRLRVKEAENGKINFYKNEEWKTETVNGEDIEIPKDWEFICLKNNVDIKTGKKDASIAKKDGKYAFFTCSKQNLKSDEYSFDCEAVLVAGNGDVGETKYYKGKFDAYQRTYILSNYKYDLKFLFIYMKTLFKSKIDALGSAMPYIKLGYLENFHIIQPININEQKDLLNIIKTFIYEKEKYEQILKEEEKKFNFLLEELMSGRLRIKN